MKNPEIHLVRNLDGFSIVGNVVFI